jgi:hypothetical protein
MSRYLTATAAISMVFVFGGGWILAAQDRQVQREALTAAKTGDLREVVQFLVRAGVSGGGIIDAEAMRRPRKAPAESIDGGTIAVADVITSLRRSRPDLVANQTNGLVFLSDSDRSACYAPLSQRFRDVRLQGPLHVVTHQLARMVNPEISAVPPTLMKRSRTPEPSVSEQIVSVFYQTLTVREAFDELSRQLQGAFWILAEGTDKNTGKPTCTVNWLFSNGSRNITSYDLIAGK